MVKLLLRNWIRVMEQYINPIIIMKKIAFLLLTLFFLTACSNKEEVIDMKMPDSPPDLVQPTGSPNE